MSFWKGFVVGGVLNGNSAGNGSNNRIGCGCLLFIGIIFYMVASIVMYFFGEVISIFENIKNAFWIVIYPSFWDVVHNLFNDHKILFIVGLLVSYCIIFGVLYGSLEKVIKNRKILDFVTYKLGAIIGVYCFIILIRIIYCIITAVFSNK